jgi:hypothetical protein
MPLPMVHLRDLIELTLVQDMLAHLWCKYKTDSIKTNEALCFRRFHEQEEIFFCTDCSR